MANEQDFAILFSGGTDSLALYGLLTAGHLQDLMRPRSIHLLHMLNGMSRFHDFPKERYHVARKILAKRASEKEKLVDSFYLELDMGRLFQGLWLDTYEILMPKYNGKNLVCVACKLAMHTRAIIYCVENFVPMLTTGYTKKQSYYPEQTPIFMEKMADLSSSFGIATTFPVYNEFDDKTVTRHVLEDFGLPSTGGGERKCLFSQTLTNAKEDEIGQYVDDMMPKLKSFIDFRLDGKVKKAAEIFPPGNTYGQE